MARRRARRIAAWRRRIRIVRALKRFRNMNDLHNVTRQAIWVILLVCLTGCKKPEAQTGSAPDSVSPAPTPTAPASAPATPQPAPVVIPARTVLDVRVNETLSSARNRPGDRFTASLERPVDIGSREVLVRGA